MRFLNISTNNERFAFKIIFLFFMSVSVIMLSGCTESQSKDREQKPDIEVPILPSKTPCEEQFGWHAVSIGQGKCDCESGFIWDAYKTSCALAPLSKKDLKKITDEANSKNPFFRDKTKTTQWSQEDENQYQAEQEQDEIDQSRQEEADEESQRDQYEQGEDQYQDYDYGRR